MLLDRRHKRLVCSKFYELLQQVNRSENESTSLSKIASGIPVDNTASQVTTERWFSSWNRLWVWRCPVQSKAVFELSPCLGVGFWWCHSPASSFWRCFWSSAQSDRPSQPERRLDEPQGVRRGGSLRRWRTPCACTAIARLFLGRSSCWRGTGTQWVKCTHMLAQVTSQPGQGKGIRICDLEQAQMPGIDWLGLTHVNNPLRASHYYGLKWGTKVILLKKLKILINRHNYFSNK